MALTIKQIDKKMNSVEGWSLYIKFLKGWSEEHIEHKCKILSKNIRSIWKIIKKGENK